MTRIVKISINELKGDKIIKVPVIGEYSLWETPLLTP